MMTNGNKYRTEQEIFWAGAFGDDYIDRNQGKELLAKKISFFSKSLQKKKYRVVWNSELVSV